MASVIRFFFMSIWTIVVMVIAPLFILITFNRQFPLIIARTVYSPLLMRIAGAKVQVIGKENVPSKEPVIVIANHASHIDIPCLCNAIPANLHFLGKKELKRVPILGWYMLVAGHIFIDRSDRKKAIESIKHAAKKIKDGKTVVLFPEGTRSRNGEIGKFKKGAFHLAIQAGVKVIPVYLEGTRKIWPAEKFKLTPGNVTISIGDPIDATNYSKENISKLMEDSRSKIIELQNRTAI